MEKATELQVSSQQPSAPTQQTSEAFTADERELTSWFFLRLQNVYGSKYTAQWPDEISVKLAKREFCKNICAFTREELHQKIELLKTVIATSEEYTWPEIPKILAISTGRAPSATNAAAYQLADENALPAPPRNKAEGKRGVAKIRELLND